jgi:2-desacetyl-2-hydroxyethyl bacteriochlorophyllide A dehydrogenase
VGNTRQGTAVWFTGLRKAELRSEEVEPAGDDGIVVTTTVSLVSSGTEMTVYHGEVASWSEVDIPSAAGELPFPIKFAYQAVGRVEEAGAGTPFSVGDSVFVYHPHQDVFRIDASGAPTDDLSSGFSLAVPLPPDLSPDRAAFANLFSVSYNALLDAPVRIGDVVVVSGLGVVGMFAALLARRTAGRLILVDPLPGRRARAEWIGADAVVDPADAAAAVAELSGGRGADIAIEASGAAPALQMALEATGQEGTIVVVSYFGNRPVTLSLAPEFHLRRQRIVSSQVALVGSGLQPRWDADRRMAMALELLREIDVSRLVTQRIPFAEAPRAYEQIDRRPDETLAVLLDY